VPAPAVRCLAGGVPQALLELARDAPARIEAHF
jgi:hypothetical protein